MKTSVIALLFSGAAVFSAHAESFTATTTSTITSSNTFQAGMGTPVRSVALSVTGQTVWAGGGTTTNKGTCMLWTAPPGSIFQTNGVCNYTESNGDTASLLAGCDYTNKDMTESNCWAGLTASAGPHAGKTGTISWHAKPSADGKSGTSQNVGQWND